MTAWPAPCPTCTGLFLSSHFAIRSRAHPDHFVGVCSLKVALNLLTPLPAFLSLILSFLPVPGLLWRVCEVLEVLQHLNCPVLSCELAHRFFSLQRSSRSLSQCFSNKAIFPVTDFSRASDYLLAKWTGSDLDLSPETVWFYSNLWCKAIQRGTEKENSPSEKETVMLMHTLTHKCRTGTVTSRNPQNWTC